MTAANQEIITCYEQLGMSPEDIAKEHGYETEAVKAILLTCSSIFKQNNRAATSRIEDDTLENGESSDYISADEFKLFTEAYKNLGLTAENEHVRARVLRHLIDEKKGRNKGKDVIAKDRTLNIVNFNINLKKAREARMKVINSEQAKEMIV